MTTKRKSSTATSREGVNFVRALVERHNATFQEIDLSNDLGNDAYIEFVVEENATGCCIAAQIKSGRSYQAPSGRFAFSSDRDHFEYWASHTLPVFGIVFDPVGNKALWVDITDYLRSRPSTVSNGPYSIEFPGDQVLSDNSFEEFRQYCLRYRDQYSREANFGRALENFSLREDEERCFDGLRALFSYHRNQLAAWYYMISSLSNYRKHAILRQLIVGLCHIPGHGDIFWGKGNIIDPGVRARARRLMRERFDRRDALTMLSVIDENGIERGSLGQCVHALVDVMADTQSVMESIATAPNETERVRVSALIIGVCAAQGASVERALDMLQRITPLLDIDAMGIAEMLKSDLVEYGFVSPY